MLARVSPTATMLARLSLLALPALARCMAVATPDAAKLYGRIAEKQLFLDKDVGACCHSACSDCEWRLPDGGYRFDLLKSMVPKVERRPEDATPAAVGR